ncbi:hypothetical protein ES705_32736 [subsurface metagenome]
MLKRIKYTAKMKTPKLIVCCLILSTATISLYSQKKDYDLSKDTVLFVVGYSHLDTQWRHDYTTTRINEMNFDVFIVY